MTEHAVRTAARRTPIGLLLVSLAGGAGLVGLMLPWAETSFESLGGAEAETANGFGEDFFGLPIVVAILLGMIAATAASRSRYLSLITAVCGIVVAFLAVVAVGKVNNTQAAAESILGTGADGVVATGTGLWITLAAGLVMVLGSLVVLLRGSRA